MLKNSTYVQHIIFYGKTNDMINNNATLIQK